MDKLFLGAKGTLQKMVNKGLMKVSDLDTPPPGWFISFTSCFRFHIFSN